MTEEQAALEYVELNIDSLASAVATSEAQLREYYEANKERFSTEGRRQVRHILIAVKDDEAAAEAKAGKVYDRVSAGEDFAALARELSDDTGSAAAGGDLGWALRGDFVAAFADAVWGMRPGETRGPVRTEFGWHVIRLEQAEADNTRSFAEVRVEIEPDVRRAEVEKQFGDQQEMLETLAFESAGNLAEIAARMNLPVRRIERFTRQGGGELGGIPALVQAVFAAAVLSGSELRTVELAPGRVVAVRVASHDPARARPLEEVRDMVVAAARLEAARRLATVKAAAVAAELLTGGEWMRVIGPWRSATAESATFQPRLVRRDETLVPAEIMQEAFRARRPEGRPRFGTARLASGDAAVWMVGAVRTGSLAALSPEEREQAIEAARESANIADAAAYVSALRAAADVDFNPQLFE
jgi:peptidyl-prolyl cis-trans isomerase D